MAENEYEQQRRAKRDQIRALGVDPYGTRTTGLTPLADAKASYKPEFGHDAGPVTKVAGRIMELRDFGKLAFLRLRDETGDLQIALDKKRLSEDNTKLRALLDLGDQIVVEGPVGVTNKGEVTIWASSFSFAAKAVLSPPAKWEGMTDTELRYRQRYVDLWANQDAMRLLKLRFRIVEEIRTYLRNHGYTEVETPMMQPLHGGAAARPFKTHHEALDIPLFLRIAPELYLKRLLVGGFSKVFELNRNFRNEGISPKHNPEFTMLEAYEAFGSWETMADMVEDMICTIAQNVLGTLVIKHEGQEGTKKEIDLSRPWRRVSMAQLVDERTDWEFAKHCISETPEALKSVLIEYAKKVGGEELLSKPGVRSYIDHVTSPSFEVEFDSQFGKDVTATPLANFYKHLMQLSPAEQLVEVYEKLVEPTLINPTFVTRVPSVIIPLARENKDDPFFADVYELAINGQEISPGYTELNDPDVQEKHFSHQVGDVAEQQKVDHDFLNALKYGMPPAGGMGLGVDRLVMMLTGAESIREIIAFPLMKPEAGA